MKEEAQIIQSLHIKTISNLILNSLKNGGFMEEKNL